MKAMKLSISRLVFRFMVLPRIVIIRKLQKRIIGGEIESFVAFMAGNSKEVKNQIIMSPTALLTESALQAACHTWFHNSHPALRGLGFMIHNDGRKHGVQATQDTARGLVPGLPDWVLCVPQPRWPKRSCCGLFVEFKVGRNGLSPIQRKRHEQLRAQGYRVEEVRELEAFQQLITEYLT